MRNELEQSWKEQEGKLLHITVDSVYPYTENIIEVSCTILENGETFSFEVVTGEGEPE